MKYGKIKNEETNDDVIEIISAGNINLSTVDNDKSDQNNEIDNIESSNRIKTKLDNNKVELEEISLNG